MLLWSQQDGTILSHWKPVVECWSGVLTVLHNLDSALTMLGVGFLTNVDQTNKQTCNQRKPLLLCFSLCRGADYSPSHAVREKCSYILRSVSHDNYHRTWWVHNQGRLSRKMWNRDSIIQASWWSVDRFAILSSRNRYWFFYHIGVFTLWMVLAIFLPFAGSWMYIQQLIPRL